VVWALARQGQAVIVGHGASWLLDPRYGLRVRDSAPLDRRVARVVELEGLAPAAARKAILAHDEERRRFAQQVFRRDIDDPLAYDLVVNYAALDQATAVEVVVTALRRKLGVKG
jgi:cytidylate kinase